MESGSTTAPAKDWPGAFGAYKLAAAATKKNVWTLLGLLVIVIFLSALGNNKQEHPNWILVLVSSLVSMLFQLALVSVYLAGARDKEQSFVDSVKVGAKNFVNGFIASILTGLILFLSFLALVVPFFFVLPRLQLVLYYLIDQNLGPVDAIKASWDNTKGHSLKVWGLIGVYAVFLVLCLVLVGFYLLFMFQTVFAALYLYINGNKPAVIPQPVAEAPKANDTAEQN